MNPNRKWFYTIEAVLAALIILLGIQMFLEKNADVPPKIAVLVQDSENQQWAAFRYGLKMAAQDTKTELSIVNTGKSLTEEEALELINREIEQDTQAVIMQPVPGNSLAIHLKKLEKKIPVMLVKNTIPISEETQTTSFPIVAPDYEAMGKALAEQLLKDYNGILSGKTIGVLLEADHMQTLAGCKQAFENMLKGTGAVLRWTASPPLPESKNNSLKKKQKVDLVIALDNRSLTAAAECAAANDLHGALVYGIANSAEAVYFLDNRTVECLIIPDEFSMGYQSLKETAENSGKLFPRMHSSKVTYYILRRETLYSEKNQEILFTMCQ